VLNDPASWSAVPRQHQRLIWAVGAVRDAEDMPSFFGSAKRLADKGDTSAFLGMHVTDETLEFFAGLCDKKYPEQVRFVVASMLAQAGYKDRAVPVLSDIALNGTSRMNRYNALQFLSQCGDDGSKAVVTKAASIPELKRGAEAILQNWPGGCPSK
jgi:hypothetical protein